MSPQSRQLGSSGSATPRSRHQSETETSRGWQQNEQDVSFSRSRHRSEEWEQNPPVRGQEILQVREEARLQEAGRQLQEACDSLLQECNQESPRSNLIIKDQLFRGPSVYEGPSCLTTTLPGR